MKTSRKNSKQRPEKLKKHAKRLAAYSAAAAATVMTTGDRSANAAEVVWDILDIAASTSSYGVRFLMTNGNTFASTYGFYYTSQGNFRLDNTYGGYLYGPAYSTGTVPNLGNLGFVGTLSVTPPTTTAPSYSLALAYPQAAGESVSSGDTFVLGSHYYYNRFAYLNWKNGQTAFAGVRFDLPTGTHYGWVQITKNGTNNFTLNGFGYNDVAGQPSMTDLTTVDLPGDLNRDGEVDMHDWAALRDNIGADLSAQTREDRYAMGDITNDGLNDIHDFGIFREAYEDFNGPGSFQAMVAGIPEPSSILLLATGAVGLGMWRKQRAG